MGKKSRVLLFIIVVLLIAVTAAWAGGAKEEKKEQTFLFKYGNQQPENHSRTKSMLFFKDELEKRTNGRIKVEVYHSGVLGTEKEMFEMTVTGNLQGYRGAFYEQLNPQFMLYNLPFLFQTYDDMIAFNKSEMAAELCKKGSVNGIYIPATGYTGFRTVINGKRPIAMPEDLKGLKMRAPGQAPIIKFYKALGANPQEMAFSEVYMASKQGVIDGSCNAAPNVEAGKLYEVHKYYTVLNYMAGADPLMVNMKWYESLPDDLKKVFNQVSKEAMALWDDMEKEASVVAIKNISSQPGVQTIITADDPAAIAAWQKALEPLWQDFVNEGYFTRDDIKKAQAIIAKAKK